MASFYEVDTADLFVLNSWPDGTVGWNQENQLIAVLNDLCKKYGYGRVPQLLQQIEDIWRNPEKRAEYAQIRKERLEQIVADKKWLEEHKDDPE